MNSSISDLWEFYPGEVVTAMIHKSQCPAFLDDDCMLLQNFQSQVQIFLLKMKTLKRNIELKLGLTEECFGGSAEFPFSVAGLTSFVASVKLGARREGALCWRFNNSIC